MILSPFHADPSTHHPAGTIVTIRTDNGGEVTGVLVAPLSVVGVTGRYGSINADLAHESNGNVLPARINASRITDVTVHEGVAA